MHDLKELLDREAGRVGTDPAALQTVVRRAGRRQRHRRVVTAAVALIVAAAGMATVFTAFGRPGPGAGPGAASYRDDPAAPDSVRKVVWRFLYARNDSRPLGRYLSPQAQETYWEGDGGLSLYGYAAEAHSLSEWAVTEAAGGWRVVVGFQGSTGVFPGGGVIKETLLIGPGRNLEGDDVDWVVLAAERNE